MVRRSLLANNSQLRHAHREAEKENIAELVRLYSVVGRMRLASDRAVIVAAKRVEDAIIETYLGPNRTLHEVIEFSRKG